jgi:hypothetical protein
MQDNLVTIAYRVAYMRVGFVGYVLYSLHVCVWARQIRQLHLMIPTSFVLCVVCVEVLSWGEQVCPPWLCTMFGSGRYPEADGVRGSAPKFVFWAFFAILVDFSIFSGFLN